MEGRRSLDGRLLLSAVFLSPMTDNGKPVKRIGQGEDKAWVETVFKTCRYAPDSKKKKKGAKEKALRLMSGWLAGSPLDYQKSLCELLPSASQLIFRELINWSDSCGWSSRS